MLIHEYTQKIYNIPAHSSWDTKKALLIQCDQCFNIYTIFKNVEKSKPKEYHFCSMNCTKTALQKDNILNKKTKRIFQEKYGVDYQFQIPAVLEKVSNTIRERYGVYNASQSEEIKQKKINTIMKNYGVTSPQKSPIIQQKTISTNNQKYGKDFYTQTNECKEKTIETCLKKYNVTNPTYIPGVFDNINPKSNFKTGYFSILNKSIFYRSSYEFRLLQCLKLQEDDITSIGTNFKIYYEYYGKLKCYFADFIIEWKSGVRQVIETKNDYLIKQEQCQVKIQTAMEYCKNNNIDFLLLNDIGLKKYEESLMRSDNF